MTLFLPPKVTRELVEERLRYIADVINACHVDEECRRWNRELRRLDNLLHMVRAPEKQVVGTPLVPGCYHLIRDNPGAPPSVTPITAADGGFMMPPGSLLEKLKSMDLWDTNVANMRRRIQEAEERREERRKETARDERRANILEHWKSVSQASVSMNRDTPWTQNASPAARRARAEARKSLLAED